MKIGSDTYGKTSIESLDLLGTAKLNGTTVQTLKITGNLIARSALLKKVGAVGNVQFEDTVVEDAIQITGSLQATGSEFRKTLLFIGQKALFSDCKLCGITVQRDGTFKAKQVIELKEGTTVSGDIVFENGEGVVFLYPRARVLGSVSGGRIARKT